MSKPDDLSVSKAEEVSLTSGAKSPLFKCFDIELLVR
jgi:hypothetical protein